MSHALSSSFRLHRLSSFQRQLSLYGFLRLTHKGPDRGAYYSELFLRDRPDLVALIPRTRVKGYWVRQSSSPETEPDFYSMPLATASGEKIQSNSMLCDDNESAPPTVSPATEQFVSSNQIAEDELIMLDTELEPIPLRQVLGSDVFGCWADVNNNLFRHMEWMGPSSQTEKSMHSVDPPSATRYGLMDQQELADFLLGLDFSDNANREQAFQNQDEHELARIYYGSLRRSKGLEVYEV